MTTTRTNLAATIDHLGTTKGAISDLTAIADQCKAFIIEAAAETGERAFEGELFRATVSFADKRVTDYKAVIDFLVKQYDIAEHDVEFALEAATKVAEGVPTVRVSARKA